MGYFLGDAYVSGYSYDTPSIRHHNGKPVISIRDAGDYTIYRYIDGTEWAEPKVHPVAKAVPAEPAKKDEPKEATPLEWLDGRVEEICKASNLQSHVDANPKANSNHKSPAEVDPHVIKETREEYWARLARRWNSPLASGY